jgi:hypothetical protein
MTQVGGHRAAVFAMAQVRRSHEAGDQSGHPIFACDWCVCSSRQGATSYGPTAFLREDFKVNLLPAV